jgi:HD-GYP domain-containing protein (c-di-GMP phosphodiesterase class II)
VVNSHPYYTYHILSQSKQLRKIAEVASKHQEKLDGTGYPFNIKAAEMAMDSRVVAVADIFTALTENRPYRENLDKGKVLAIMAEMSRENHIDISLFTLVKENYELLDAKRIAEQTYSKAHYETFWQNAEETITQLQQSAA